MARRLAPIVPAVLLAPFALSVNYLADFGLAYNGGLEAWSSGHPQRLNSWTGTPLYAVVMAAITRLASVEVSAKVFMALDLLVLAALMYVVWDRLRDHVPGGWVGWWWATLVAAAVFAPTISNIFWLQPNLFMYALVLGGFVLVGRRDFPAGVLIGISLAVKPIFVLLPLALLLRRESRAAGLWSLATAATLTLAGLGFLAWRAGDPAVANPFEYLSGFLGKGQGATFGCVPENYAPVATLCRLGLQPNSLLTAGVGLVVLAAGWLLVRGLPAWPESRWAIFGLACLLSTMAGPINWATYGILLIPLFLLLAYEFWRDGAPPALWIALALAYLLNELVWDPLESLAQAPVALVVVSYSAGQFGKYVLLFTWIRRRMLRPRPVSAATPAGALQG